MASDMSARDAQLTRAWTEQQEQLRKELAATQTRLQDMQRALLQVRVRPKQVGRWRVDGLITVILVGNSTRAQAEKAKLTLETTAKQAEHREKDALAQLKKVQQDLIRTEERATKALVCGCPAHASRRLDTL